MKYVFLLTILICTFAATGIAQIQPVKLEGYYLPKNIVGRESAAMKEFRGFEHLALSSTSARNISGFVVTKSGSFKIVKPKLFGTQFDFKTTAVNGISYSFSGRFAMTDFSDSTEESEILSGVLFKYRNGKTLAAVDLDFDYWVGD